MNELKDVKIVEVDDYYDGPLSGWCEVEGNRYYFYWDDEVPRSEGGTRWKFLAIKVPEDFTHSLFVEADCSYEEYFAPYEKAGCFFDEDVVYVNEGSNQCE